MSSPPSADTPASVYEERLQQQRLRQELVDNMQTCIGLTIRLSLDKLKQADPLVYFLRQLLLSELLIDKRYKVAQAINELSDDKDLDDPVVSEALLASLHAAVLNCGSKLYEALNYQRNVWPYLTVFGPKKVVSFQYARSLQAAQQIAENVQTARSSNYRTGPR